jgi:hypothetical protein
MRIVFTAGALGATTTGDEITPEAQAVLEPTARAMSGWLSNMESVLKQRIRVRLQDRLDDDVVLGLLDDVLVLELQPLQGRDRIL